MKIKVLHYVFGPCMKGYDISAKKVIVQMGQKTIGLSEELLSYPDVLETLGELAFGDTIDKNTPFKKIYFAPLTGGKWVIGRGIRGMDRAGRKALFFHHLVVDEADLIKIKGNLFVIYRKFKFFENETDLPENRLIPPTEIDISKEDGEFPVLDSVNKPYVENLLSDIFSKKPGQPIWVIIKRGKERLFIESLFGIGGIEKYSIDEETYRKFVDIGMNMVKEYEMSFKKMCDYLYVTNDNRVFIEMLLQFIQEPGLNFNPVELLIYMERKDWITPDTRKGIFAYLKKGKIKLSQIRKYQDFLKRTEKDLPGYKPIWKEIEKKAPKGLLDSLFG